MVPKELEVWVLQIMEDELAARKADRETSEHDARGHPTPSPNALPRILRAA